MYRRWCYAQVCDALHSNYVLLDLKVMYYVSSEPPTERPKDQKLAMTRKEVLVKTNSNRYNEVVEIQAKGTLTLCRLKVNSGIEEVERPRGQKATKKVQVQKYKKQCGRTRFRNAKQARQALWAAFSGLDGQAGDALLGTHVGNLVVSCDSCRGYHLSSPSEWLGTEVPFAA